MDKQIEIGLNALFAGIVMICGFIIFLIGLADLTKDFWGLGEVSAVALMAFGLLAIGGTWAYINRKKSR